MAEQYIGPNNPYMNGLPNGGYNSNGGRGLVIGGTPMPKPPVGSIASGGAPQQPYTPSAPQPSQGGGGGMPSDYGGSGGYQSPYPMMMLEAQTQQAPVPVGGGNTAPQEMAETPPPTIFDVGNRVAANPNMARRNPAYEGLLRRFKTQRAY